MSKNNPANRNALDHAKQGVKQIGKTYKALYTSQGGIGGPKDNIKAIVTGRTSKHTPKIPAATRASAAAMGAASVTPLGPVAAFASGVRKSVVAKADAKAAAKAPKVTAPQKEIKLAIRKPAAAAPAAAKPPARPATPAPMNKPGAPRPKA